MNTTPQEHTDAITALFPASVYTPVNENAEIAKVVVGSIVGGVVGAIWLNAVINLITPWKGFK